MEFALFVFYSFLLAGMVWLSWYLANQFYDAAQAKGYHDRKYFWISFLLGWIGYILVVALPDRNISRMAQGNRNVPLYDELPDL